MINTLFEERAENLTSIAKRLAAALDSGGFDYRIVGGYAIYLHVDAIDPIAARMTRDVDVAVRRADLERIRKVIEPFGFIYKHAAGGDMFLDANEPKAKSAVHLVFIGEKVRPEYTEPVPDFGACGDC